MGLLDKFDSGIKGLNEQVIKPVTGFVPDMLSEGGKKITGLIDWTKNKVQKVLNWPVDAGTKAVNWVIEETASLGQPLKEASQGIGNTATALLAERSLTRTASEILKGSGKTITSVPFIGKPLNYIGKHIPILGPAIFN